MSDLTATNCGSSCSCDNNNSCSNILFILLILSACGGCNGSSFLGGNGNGCGCESILFILLILSSCGCGCNGLF